MQLTPARRKMLKRWFNSEASFEVELTTDQVGNLRELL